MGQEPEEGREQRRGEDRGCTRDAEPPGSRLLFPGPVTGSFPAGQRKGAIPGAGGRAGMREPAAAGHRGWTRRRARRAGPAVSRGRAVSSPEAHGEVRTRRLRAHGKRGVTEGAGRGGRPS